MCTITVTHMRALRVRQPCGSTRAPPARGRHHELCISGKTEVTDYRYACLPTAQLTFAVSRPHLPSPHSLDGQPSEGVPRPTQGPHPPHPTLFPTLRIACVTCSPPPSHPAYHSHGQPTKAAANVQEGHRQFVQLRCPGPHPRSTHLIVSPPKPHPMSRKRTAGASACPCPSCACCCCSLHFWNTSG